MRAWALPAILLTMAAAPPAIAQPPLLRPSRDVVVAYHVGGVTAGEDRAGMVRIYFADHGDKMRIEPVGQPNYSIVDRAAARMFIVIPAQHAYVALPYDSSRVMAFDATGASFTRLGTDTVAGLPCTVYEETRQGHSGQVCISGDGLLLRVHANDPIRVNGDLQAISVTYGPQPPALFAPPPGYQAMALAAVPR